MSQTEPLSTKTILEQMAETEWFASKVGAPITLSLHEYRVVLAELARLTGEMAEMEDREAALETELARSMAEVAELRRERDMWSQLWDNVRLDNPNLRDDNKPLAIAACYALMKLEMDRMREALVMSVNAMREPFDGWKGEVEALALAAARSALGEQP